MDFFLLNMIKTTKKFLKNVLEKLLNNKYFCVFIYDIVFKKYNILVNQISKFKYYKMQLNIEWLFFLSSLEVAAPTVFMD